MTANARPGQRPMLAAILGAACISCSAILVTLAGTAAATTTFFRCVLALPVLAALALIEQRRHGAARRRARLDAVVAGLLLAVDLVLWNHSIAEVGAGVATVLGQPPGGVRRRWPPGRCSASGRGGRFLFALPVVMAGVVLVSGLADGGGSGHHALAGIIYGVGTSIAYAAFLLIFRHSSTGTGRHVPGR